MPDYQALESKHLQEPPSQPAHDEEQEETMSTNEKTADEAGTSTTAQENLPKTSSIAYMGRTGDNTRHSFGTWSGEQLPTIC